MRWYDGYGYGMMGNDWSWIMMLGMFALFIVGVAVFLWLIKNPRQLENNPSAEKPLEILNARYAKGELSDEEYQKKKVSILQSH